MAEYVNCVVVRDRPHRTRLAECPKRGYRPSQRPEVKTIAKRKQYAALPYTLSHGHVMVCLVTSRDTQRFVIPKGWPKRRLAPHKLAAVEARQEAGLVGQIEREPIGEYTYRKDMKHDCRVQVFPLFVTSQLETWKEADQRQRQWVTAEEAALLVNEPELSDLLSDLDEWL